MSPTDLKGMSEHYRCVRKAVYEKATAEDNLEKHKANKTLFRAFVNRICDEARLEHFRGQDSTIASAIWHHLWTKIKFAGIKAALAEKEIKDIQVIFDDFGGFENDAWTIEAKAHIVSREGSEARDFRKRTGRFANKTTIGLVPKLIKIVNLARRLKKWLDTKAADTPVIHFITNGVIEDDVWAIHRHLQDIGYTGHLTALHFMMALGFEVMKPDIVITRQFLGWGWLHKIIPDLPTDVSFKDLRGKGSHGAKVLYTRPAMYKPVIELSRKIAKATNSDDLKNDIGWVTHNPLREFDIFMVKFGQQPDPSIGIVRKLHEGKEEVTAGACSSEPFTRRQSEGRARKRNV